MSKYTEQIDQAVTKLNQETARQQLVLQNMFNETCKQLFVDYPEITSVTFKCYTPYFNDGEACEFNAYVDEPDVNEYYRYDDDESEATKFYEKIGIWEDWKKTIPNPNYDARITEASEAWEEFLSAIPTEIYKNLFGNNVKVTLKEDEVLTEDYSDHD